MRLLVIVKQYKHILAQAKMVTFIACFSVFLFLCLAIVILEAINKAAEAWGVDCKRYEIRKS